MNYGGIPSHKNNNPNYRKDYKYKHMEAPVVNGQIQPKFNNHLLGNGKEGYKNGAEATIFDAESKDSRMNAAYK